MKSNRLFPFNHFEPLSIFLNSTLFEAASRNNISLLVGSLAGEYGEVTQDDKDEALLQAATCGYEEVVVHLLEAGADPDTDDCNGDTPLIVAATYNRISK